MSFNKKGDSTLFLIVIIYLIVSYFVLNQNLNNLPAAQKLLAITTNPFSYYDLRTVTYIYSLFYLLIIINKLENSPINILRIGNRGKILYTDFRTLVKTAFSFVFTHGGIGLLLTWILFGYEVISSNSFLLLAFIFSVILFLYLINISLLLLIFRRYFSDNISLGLCMLSIVLGYFLNTIFWTPVLDTRIFGMAYVDTVGLSINKIISISVRQFGLLLALFLVNSTLIQRKDYIND